MNKLSKVLLLATLIFVVGMSSVKAQKPYKMGIGAVVGTMEGASFKVFFSEKIALQADLGVKYGSYRIKGDGYWIRNWKYNFWTIEINPNLMYEGVIKDWDFGGLYWFAGAGVGLGYVISSGYGNTGKFGVNAMGGVEYSFNKIPLALQFDFRPGYGLLFANGTQSFFDWATTLSVRYTF